MMAVLAMALFTAWVQLMIGGLAEAVDTGIGREATLGGMCLTSTVPDEATLRTLRRKVVKFNQKKR